jgi:regulator of replication initiation timing
MFAVREEVEVLKEKIAELMERIGTLEYENSLLRAHATPDTLSLLPQQQQQQQVQQVQQINGSSSLPPPSNNNNNPSLS